MSIILVGLNHSTAPVELREQLSLNGCALDMALEEFAQRFIDRVGGLDAPTRLPEGVFLSTCNRLELYVVSSAESEREIHQSWQTLVHFLATLQGVDIEHLSEHVYFKADHEAVTHLMRVTSGLDSMILGEPQILGQVVHAYKAAHAAGTTGPLLSQLFSQAIHAGKRARSETQISRYTTSISHAAARLAAEKLSRMCEAEILIVGAGEMARLAGQVFKMYMAEHISVINRTYSSAAVLAAELGAVPVAWHHLDKALASADLVVTATGAPHLVIQRETVERALSDRNGRPLLFMDIAVPRDVDPEVNSLSGVSCYDVDSLQTTVDENMAQRLAEVPKVEAIIADEALNMIEWISQREIVPVIVDIRSKAKEIAANELSDAKRRLQKLDPHAAEVAEDLLERLAHRLVNKLLHQPTVQLKERASAGDSAEYAYMIRELFQLHDTATATAHAAPMESAIAENNLNYG